MSVTISTMWEQTMEGFGAAQTEIAIFVIAALTHAVFRGMRTGRRSSLANKAKSIDTSGTEDAKNNARKTPQSPSSEPGSNHNSLLRAHLQKGAYKEARALLDDMRQKELLPSRAAYNELVDAGMKISIDEAWGIIDDMKTCGVKPDRATCSILLKSIQKTQRKVDASPSGGENVSRILSLLDDIEGEADEVLLNSFIDAYIRIGHSDLLAAHLKKLRSSKKMQVKSPHGYANLIRACGFAGDIAGVWETWRDMRKQQTTPTSITLGCIVEALTSNGETDASYELLQEMLSDPVCKPLVNSVIYGSVLKGFSHQKRFDRAWSMYKEMLQHNLQFSIVTFNTLLDACARSGEMARIPVLLESMSAQGIEPNLITYGIVIKAYCQDNRLDEALQVWESMVSSTNFQPDEIMYNTLLDGCARKGLYDRGMVLLADMQKSNVRLTNFTLSVLVRLASRAHLLDRAFELCKEVSGKYKFRLNVHVFNNLIQACVTHNQLQRAFDVLDQLVCERVRPDLRTYTLLIKGCMAAKEAKQTVGLVRAAFGLQGMHPAFATCASFARLQNGLSTDFVVEVLENISGQCHDNALAVALMNDLKSVPNLGLPTHLQLHLTNKVMRR